MTKPLSVINIFLVVAVAVLFLYGLQTIPGDQQVPVHWNVQGEVDFTLAARWALWIGPLEVVIVVTAFFIAKAKLPAEEFEAGLHLTSASISIALAAGLFVQTVVTLGANGVELDMMQLAALFIGYVMLVVGNYLPKSQPNRSAGIRLPWTLNSDVNWTRTHQFAGKAFMLAGILSVAIGLLNPGQQITLLAAILCVATAIVITVFYSYSAREA